MKIALFFRYPPRSLMRGGHYSLLAVFCVAVGVMAVVALQLVGFMLQNSLTTNVRESNGGDISVTTLGLPLTAGDLTFFDQMKRTGMISGYTALTRADGSLTASASSANTFTVEAVDPKTFPLVDQPTFIQPEQGSVASLLGNNRVIVTQQFLAAYHKQVGDTFTVYVKGTTGSGSTLPTRIAGVVANSGLFAQATSLLLISDRDYQATSPYVPATYTTVDVTTPDQAHTDIAVAEIGGRFPVVSTQTVADLLKSEQSTIDVITRFLEVTGLLSLMIGGVGIAHSMQVLLSRRRMEIAVLKTTGYRRTHLYMLFGLEAGLLGLVGGIIGSIAAIGVSYLVRGLTQNLGQNVPYVLDPKIVVGGMATGAATALIFALLPIVQAANVRPMYVLREQEMRGARSSAQTLGLLALLSLVFCALATMIVNDDLALGIAATYGTLAFLLVLSAFFGLVVILISRLPIPEHLQWQQILLVLLGLAISGVLYRVVPVLGLYLLLAALLGLVVTLLPRSWKVSTKMALRNLGRQRARTTATLVAFFIGIFGIALVSGLGLNLQSQITTTLAQNEPYNLVVTTSGQDASSLAKQLGTIPGLTSSREGIVTSAEPIAINGQGSRQVLSAVDPYDRQEAASFLSTVEGENLSTPGPTLTMLEGRNLNASDAGTNNVVVNQMLTSRGWLQMNLKLGDTITYASPDGKVIKTVTIVGIIAIRSSAETLGKVLAPAAVVRSLSLSGSAASTIFYMKVNGAQLNQAEDQLGRVVPNATIQDVTSVATSFIQQLNNILDMLVAIASLSLVAAIVIIANAVALAMLQRRRELGILKSVGYTSGVLLSEVLVENGIMGALGAFSATVLASGGVVILGNVVFGHKLTMPPLIITSLLVGSIAVAVLTAVLVALGPVRVRPLAVLHYE